MLKSYFSYLYENTSINSTKCLYSLLEKDSKAILLDCGCWDGINTKKFGSIINAAKLYGIEIDRAKADEAAKKGIMVKISDLNKKFPFESDFFDVVIAYHVIEHLINVRSFASEIYRVLKKNGYAVIGTPNLASWHNVFALLLGVQPFSGPTIKPDYESDIKLVRGINKDRMEKVFSKKTDSLDHIKVMTAKALIGLLKDYKFKIEDVKGFGYYPLPPLIAGFLAKIDPFHSHYIVVKARK